MVIIIIIIKKVATTYKMDGEEFGEDEEECQDGVLECKNEKKNQREKTY